MYSHERVSRLVQDRGVVPFMWLEGVSRGAPMVGLVGRLLRPLVSGTPVIKFGLAVRSWDPLVVGPCSYQRLLGAWVESWGDFLNKKVSFGDSPPPRLVGHVLLHVLWYAPTP
jgi:hypothetical protein